MKDNMEKEGKKTGEEEEKEKEKVRRRSYKKVGYALATGKVETMIQPSLIASCVESGIHLIPLDPTKPLVVQLQQQQSPFDCIVHKIYGHDWNQNLSEFTTKHPDIPIIDSPDAIQRLHNRISMLQVLQHIKPQYHSHQNNATTTTTIRVGIPKQVVLNDSSATDADLNYPLIAKPLVANGKDESHSMALVYDPKGTIGLKTPIVLQEFVNHGGVIFKVYVAGKHIECVKRRSLPDISEDELKMLSGRLPFSQISNLTAPQYKKDKEDVVTQTIIDNTVMPPLDFVNDLANGMREGLGLNLFNFDMIREATDENSYLVIDINYFPGYAKIPSYETMLTNFFLDIVSKDAM